MGGGDVRPRFFSAALVATKANEVVPASGTHVPDNLAVNGARDAVLQLEVHLGNRVLSEHRSVRDITCKVPMVSQMSSCARGGEVGLAEEVVGNPEPSVTYGSQQTQPCCG